MNLGKEFAEKLAIEVLKVSRGRKLKIIARSRERFSVSMCRKVCRNYEAGGEE